MRTHDMIRDYLRGNLPFAAHAGVDLVDLGDGTGLAHLPQTENTLNHIGTQHAGALFTLGETASGAAAAGVFAERLLSLRTVAREARIRYMKVAKGTITAEARTDRTPDDLRATLDAEGRVAFDVIVTFRDADGVETGEMTVAWDVRKP
ncbi:MAG: PaaI family thioesterase [Rubricella sp.]